MTDAEFQVVMIFCVILFAGIGGAIVGFKNHIANMKKKKAEKN